MEFQENIIRAKPGVFDEKTTTESKKIYPQTVAQFKIIKILLEYVKNKNAGKIDNFVH